MKDSRGQSIHMLDEPDTDPGRPLYIRLYLRIRDGVLQGAIAPGTRLPSARVLARELGVSRNTVEAALRQLQAEGFVVRRVGSGTRVADDLPVRLLKPRAGRVSRARGGGEPRRGASRRPGALSARGRWVEAAGDETVLPSGMTFAPCLPGVEGMPWEVWDRIAGRHVRRSARYRLRPAPAGLWALREAIAGYVHMSRGVRCTPDQVVVVDSAQQAIDLVARMVLDPGDAVWMEDPGYVSARRAFVAAGARPVPVPVDEDGIDVARGKAVAPDARLAYVTPSHQYPMGVTLSLARRLELLEWAADAGSWILEDDYDSELRYDGRPLASVQSLDGSGRVLYVGTFNKVLFPGLRIAYLVLPEELVAAFVRAKEISSGATPPLFQRVLAEFISEGHFSVYLRRVRDVLTQRRDRFVQLAREMLPDSVRLGPAEGGMHAVLHVPPHVDDRVLSERARRHWLAVPPLSSYAVESQARGLVVHYGNAPLSDIETGVGTLGRILAKARVVRRATAQVD